MIEIETYIQPGDQITVVYRSSLEGFTGSVLEISDGVPGAREITIVRSGHDLAEDGAIGVSERNAIFTVQRGDAWVQVPPLLTPQEAELKSARNAANQRKRIEQRTPLLADQIAVEVIPPVEMVQRFRDGAQEHLQRDHEAALQATALRTRVCDLVTSEQYEQLLNARSRYPTTGLYGTYFWRRQFKHIERTGQPDIFVPPPSVKERLSLPWLSHDSKLTWVSAPFGPRRVRVLFVGSTCVLAQLLDRDVPLSQRNVWLHPADFAEAAS